MSSQQTEQICSSKRRRQSFLSSLFRPDDVELAVISASTMALCSGTSFILVYLIFSPRFLDNLWFLLILAPFAGGILGWIWIPRPPFPRRVFPKLLVRGVVRGVLFAFAGAVVGAILLCLLLSIPTIGASLLFVPLALLAGVVHAVPAGSPGTILGSVIVLIIAQKRHARRNAD